MIQTVLVRATKSWELFFKTDSFIGFHHFPTKEKEKKYKKARIVVKKHRPSMVSTYNIASGKTRLRHVNQIVYGNIRSIEYNSELLCYNEV